MFRRSKYVRRRRCETRAALFTPQLKGFTDDLMLWQRGKVVPLGLTPVNSPWERSYQAISYLPAGIALLGGWEIG